MTFEEWIKDQPDGYYSNDAIFQAGAASRDAEIARLLEINSNICERSNRNITEIARLEKERDQLRAHINTLTEALEFCSGTSYMDDAHKMANETLALIGSKP